MTALWWIRRDLRLHDNQALQSALSWANTVIPVYILDPYILSRAAPGRASFLFMCLRSLSADLLSAGSSLVIRRGKPDLELARLLAESGAGIITAEADYSPYALRRDQKIAENLPLRLVQGLTIQPPGMVLKTDGSPYTVFTPFWRAWQALPRTAPPILEQIQLKPHPALDSLPIPETEIISDFPVSESAARACLQDFLCEDHIGRYHSQRDRLDLPGTSRLSPCLRFGLLSARYAYAQAEQFLSNPSLQPGVSAWLNELIWREFYYHILAAFPDVLRFAFRRQFRKVPWRDAPSDLRAWQSGLTGYPIVDASMRQLAQTGWMHNRARMLTASFLTKDLLINWQAGEKWFMQNLLDGDPACNNGGWQWCAGTGADAAPYFRIFNPRAAGA